MTIAIVLGRHAHESRVLLDGNDITTSVFGIEVRAFMGEQSKVTLTLSSRVEITGDVGVTFKGPEGLGTMRDKILAELDKAEGDKEP